MARGYKVDRWDFGGEGGRRGTYSTLTPNMLSAAPVQTLDAASFHGDDVFSGGGVDYSRAAALAEEAV